MTKGDSNIGVLSLRGAAFECPLGWVELPLSRNGTDVTDVVLS